jgi:hypothetical protein
LQDTPAPAVLRFTSAAKASDFACASNNPALAARTVNTATSDYASIANGMQSTRRTRAVNDVATQTGAAKRNRRSLFFAKRFLGRAVPLL